MSTLRSGGREYRIASLPHAAGNALLGVPFSRRILYENLLRHADAAAQALLDPCARDVEIGLRPARVVMQDYSGFPALVDLAGMREAAAANGVDPRSIDPAIPVDVVIDHSLMVDAAGTHDAPARNLALEVSRNYERYAFFRWCRSAFGNLRIVPPGKGIIHQINLEALASVVCTREREDGTWAYPDLLVGTDSHTPMIGGIGVLAWGVGGIEAEAAMLGEALSLVVPPVVGVRLHGALPPGATPTDLVLTLTERLRAEDLVGSMLEFIGEGAASLSVPDRATLANMTPEYGATSSYFPIDARTLEYLRLTGRREEHVELVETYACAQMLFADETSSREVVYARTIDVDLSAVEPAVAGPRRPEERRTLAQVPAAFAAMAANGSPRPAERTTLSDGDVVIAAITSCTNTSNPAAMIAAGLLARNAVARGLRAAPHVKTSLAPGSRVVADYLTAAGLQPALDTLGFNLVGFGCTTCVGNSGPLLPEVESALTERDRVVAAVLSGNRNFEGRIHARVKAAFLAAPALVIAYALAGNVRIDLTAEPLGYDADRRAVFLADVWPSRDEIDGCVARFVRSELFAQRAADVFEGDAAWNGIAAPSGATYAWDAQSTYVQAPPFATLLPVDGDIRAARILALLGDGITTDHISPVGAIAAPSPAGRRLAAMGCAPEDFNAYGARRGDHEIIVRGTFANPRLRNALAPEAPGGSTRHEPSGEIASIYDVAMRYERENVPAVIVAGRNYGAGSARDTAAKGTRLLGVRAVIAESFERIHRDNLVRLGVAPLEITASDRAALALDGTETLDVLGLGAGLRVRGNAELVISRKNGATVRVPLLVRIDTSEELGYYRAGGILPAVFAAFLANALRAGSPA